MTKVKFQILLAYTEENQITVTNIIHFTDPLKFSINCQIIAS